MKVHFKALGGSVTHKLTLALLGRHGKNSPITMIRHVMRHAGKAFDYLNIFPTYDIYLEQLRILIDKIVPNGLLIYNVTDEECVRLIKQKNKAQQKFRGVNGK